MLTEGGKNNGYRFFLSENVEFLRDRNYCNNMDKRGANKVFINYLPGYLRILSTTERIKYGQLT